jgi:hypothetical protein
LAAVAEHLGEVRRLDLADHHVRIGHGQRAAAPVAGRAGIGARTLGPTRKRAPSNPGSSRHRPPRCGCSSWARACARRPPGSRTRARTRRRSGSRRCWCRPCRSRSRDHARQLAVRAMPTMPPAGPDRIASLP